MNLYRFFQRFSLIIALLLVGALVLAACGGDDDDDDEGPTATANSGAQTAAISGDGGEPTVAGDDATVAGVATEGGDGAATEADGEDEGADLSGSINADGSSTVFPVTQGVAEEFGREHPDVQITVGFSGTGGGFEKFCSGDTQISNASRPIKDEEVAACEEAGIEFTEFRVAIDGLSVVVNPANDWVDCLTMDQLTAMFGPESTVTTWADVDPSWPDEDIGFYIPGTDSGTFDYFTETVGGESGATRTEGLVTSEDDNVLVTGIEGDQYGIGYFGYAYYSENQDRLKVLGIDSGSGCVEPNDETVQGVTYEPLSRPLFIYVNNAMLAEQPELAAFVEYYFTDGLIVVPEVGYVPYPDDVYQENLATLAEVAGS